MFGVATTSGLRSYPPVGKYTDGDNVVIYGEGGPKTYVVDQ